MKIITTSDSHGYHAKLSMPEGDVFIHTGDFTGDGSPEALLDFCNWLEDLSYSHKIVIAGNHDGICEQKPQEVKEAFARYDITYLCDESVTIDGVKFYGSPWTPTFMFWHFMLDRGKEIGAKWSLIPEDTDILITHGPPAGIMDTVSGIPQGCSDLLERVRKVNPRYHIFGHIHEHYGSVRLLNSSPENGTTFVNCCALDERYRLVREPVVFEI